MQSYTKRTVYTDQEEETIYYNNYNVREPGTTFRNGEPGAEEGDIFFIH